MTLYSSSLPVRPSQPPSSSSSSSSASSSTASSLSQQKQQEQEQQHSQQQSYQHTESQEYQQSVFYTTPSHVNINVTSLSGNSSLAPTALSSSNLYSSYSNPNAAVMLSASSSAHCCSASTPTSNPVSHAFSGENHMTSSTFLSTSLPLFNPASSVILSQGVSSSAPLSLALHSTSQNAEASYINTPKTDKVIGTLPNCSHTTTTNTEEFRRESSNLINFCETTAVKDSSIGLSSLNESIGNQPLSSESGTRNARNEDITTNNDSPITFSPHNNSIPCGDSGRVLEFVTGTNSVTPPSSLVPGTLHETSFGSTGLVTEPSVSGDSFLLSSRQSSPSCDVHQNEEVRLGISSDLMVFPSLSQLLLRSQTTSCQESYETQEPTLDLESQDQRKPQHMSPHIAPSFQASSPVTSCAEELITQKFHTPLSYSEKNFLPLDALFSVSHLSSCRERQQGVYELQSQRPPSCIPTGMPRLEPPSTPHSEQDDISLKSSNLISSHESPVQDISQLLLVDVNNNPSAQHRKTTKKRRITTRIAESPTKAQRQTESPVTKNKPLPNSFGAQNINSTLPSRYEGTHSNETSYDVTSGTGLPPLSNLVDDLITSRELADPMGLFGKSSNLDPPLSTSKLSNVSDLVKRMCFRNVQRHRDLNELNRLINLDRTNPHNVSNDSDQPPPLVSSNYELQLTHLAELSEREMKVLTIQQHCFRLLKNISLCCHSWANHEGSYFWHTSYLLGASNLNDITSYSLIFEDLVYDIALRLCEAQQKVASMNSGESSQPTLKQPNLDPLKSQEVTKDASCPSTSEADDIKKNVQTVEHGTFSMYPTDLSGALLTSLVHQIDSTTMAQSLMLLDGLRQHHDPTFRPLPSLQNTLSTFVALQALHGVYQSPVNFLLGTSTRFRSASNLGAGRGSKKRTSIVSNLSTGTNTSFATPATSGLNIVPKARGITGAYGRSRKQLGNATAPTLHAPTLKSSGITTSEPTLVSPQIFDPDLHVKRGDLSSSSHQALALESPSDFTVPFHKHGAESSLLRSQSSSNDQNWFSQTPSQTAQYRDKNSIDTSLLKREQLAQEGDGDDKDEKRNEKNIYNASLTSSGSEDGVHTTMPYPLSSTVTNRAINTTSESFPAEFVSLDTTSKPLDLSTSIDNSCNTTCNHSKVVSAQSTASPSVDLNFLNTDVPELPRDPEAFRSQVKGVYYDDTSNRWCASWHERKTGKKKSRYFAVKKFGFSTAKTHAMDARLEAEESGECAPTNII